MRQNSGPQSAEKHVKEIRRRTRRKFSAEEKIRIVLAGLRGDGVHAFLLACAHAASACGRASCKNAKAPGTVRFRALAEVVEKKGIEPSTSALRTRRSPN